MRNKIIDFLLSVGIVTLMVLGMVDLKSCSGMKIVPMAKPYIEPPKSKRQPYVKPKDNPNAWRMIKPCEEIDPCLD